MIKLKFTKPLSGRQMGRAFAVIDGFRRNKFISAFDALYFFIDDWGNQYKQKRGKYKALTINEAIILGALISSFLNQLPVPGMRCSGKRDKNSTMIHEGDILENEYRIKRVIVTHIDEYWGKSYAYYQKIENSLDNTSFAYDGMKIIL